MGILKDLRIVCDVAKKNNIDIPYIVGGVARDYAIGEGPLKTLDVDLTTNTPDSMRLGILSAEKFNKSFKIFNDKHVAVYFDDYSVDFSSNFKSEGVMEYLNEKGIYDEKLYEVYSRDFSVNTLHQDIHSREILDLTKSALSDIDSKIIKTPVDPSITLVDDPRRVFRAIYLSSKYNFSIDDSIVDFLINNNDLIYSGSISDSFVTSRVAMAMSSSPDLTIENLKKIGAFSRVPLTGFFKNYLIKNKLVVDYLDGSDHDFDEKLASINLWSKAKGLPEHSITRVANSNGCSPIAISQNAELIKQLDIFMDAILEKEGGRNYTARANRDSDRVAVGGYQILDSNWYGRATSGGYYFDSNKIIKEDDESGGATYRYCDDRDLVSGGKMQPSNCTKCKENPCYRLFEVGDDLPDEHSWVYQALNSRSVSYMSSKDDEEKYLKGESAEPNVFAQDAVAKHKMSEYFENFYCRFVNTNDSGGHALDQSNKQVWGAVAASWYAGEGHGYKRHSSRSKKPIRYKHRGISKNNCTCRICEWNDELGVCEKVYPSIWSYTNSVMERYSSAYGAPTKEEPAEITPPTDEPDSTPRCFEFNEELHKLEEIRCEGSARSSMVKELYKFSRPNRSLDPENMKDIRLDGNTYRGAPIRKAFYTSIGGLPEVEIYNNELQSWSNGDANFLKRQLLKYTKSIGSNSVPYYNLES